MHPELGESIGKVIFRRCRNDQQPRTQKNKWTPDQPQRIPNIFTLFVRGHREQKIETHKLSPMAPKRDIQKRCIKVTAWAPATRETEVKHQMPKNHENSKIMSFDIDFTHQRKKMWNEWIHSLLLVLATYLASKIGTITKYPSKV
jgi:hypothetical protein